MKFQVVIPARLASTRLPGKPLLDIAGKPMIQHVYERVIACGAENVVIATDHEDVEKVAKQFGAQVCMTSELHRSGTERLSEVIEKMGWGSDEIIVNVQGDEPMIPKALINQVARNLNDYTDARASTLCEKITEASEFFDPNAVKVVFDKFGMAMYFSRAPIPWNRDAFTVDRVGLPNDGQYFRHIGLYAYRAGLVQEYTAWAPCELEGVEALEQLRMLWYGHKIHVEEACEKTALGVDTEADLALVRQLLQ